MAVNKLDAARRLIRVALGDANPDGEIIMNYGVGSSVRGYDSDATWVLGDWNTDLGTRLFDAFERLGIEAEWYDQYDECQECHKLIQTQPDHYGWKAEFAWVSEVGNVCYDCLVNVYGEDALDEYINRPERAITWASPALLEGYGYTRYNEDKYESGFHPGQTDTPTTIFAQIRAERPEAQVVFLIDDVGQFDIHFSAYVKEQTEDD